ncbi:MAG: prepilin-type N-terminal cleavage/methylation domain-containing protein [Reyranella sp.]|nr:prepilin-type N-terminal cleavage/methylation domain-containing protein [Sulfuritalea sp.]MDP1962483.1 prepilin-type N-terminal cleavage/methylation domain-containing protein [Reyranella sp.]
MARRGFTLIELLVVMTIVAILLTLVAPRYFRHVDNSKEIVLRQNLEQVRDAIDKFRADSGKLPASLEDLVDKRYLRGLPVDPITESKDTWTLIPAKSGEPTGLADIRSGAPGKAADGSLYADW